MKKDWIKVTEAAERVNRKRHTLYERIEKGSIPKKEVKEYPVLMVNWNFVKELYGL